MMLHHHASCSICCRAGMQVSLWSRHAITCWGFARSAHCCYFAATCMHAYTCFMRHTACMACNEQALRLPLCPDLPLFSLDISHLIYAVPQAKAAAFSVHSSFGHLLLHAAIATTSPWAVLLWLEHKKVCMLQQRHWMSRCVLHVS